MLSPKYYFYFAIGPQVQSKVQITSNPRVDAYILERAGYQEIYLIQPPQPVWIAEAAFREIVRLQIVDQRKFEKIAPRLINEVYPQKHFSLNRFLIKDLRMEDIDLPGEERLFWGKSLLGTEVPGLLNATGCKVPWDPENWLQFLYFHSKIRREAAVSVDNLGIPYCRRCGSTRDIFEDNCQFCGSRSCYTCSNCQTMGIAKSCIPLYSMACPDQTGHPTANMEEIRPQLNFELTPPQQRASAALEKFLDSEAPRFLVWAVCGGGKTEVSFQIVAKTLSRGGRVLFAIPRKDVVIELVPRFQKAFPNLRISALYGGSGERFSDAPLTIATTHQCLRFFQGFDLIILDEADAFPYQGSEMLHYAVQRSLKPGGRLVIMTATPDRWLIEKARAGEIPSVSIPARYHRRPLAVPELVKLDLKFADQHRQKWEPPSFIQEFFFRTKLSGRKALIFLPTIKSIEEIGKALVEWGRNREIHGEFIHSKRTNRTDARNDLQRGEIHFLVTSTILERGITIPNLDVMVLMADQETVFDCRTLVQIAGRVSRLGEPARVIFCAKTFSKGMKDCCHWIETMNREGRELGYVD